jgi:hypothetical protein
VLRIGHAVAAAALKAAIRSASDGRNIVAAEPKLPEFAIAAALQFARDLGDLTAPRGPDPIPFRELDTSFLHLATSFQGNQNRPTSPDGSRE